MRAVSPEELARAVKEPGFEIHEVVESYIPEVDVEYKVTDQEYSTTISASSYDHLGQAASGLQEFPVGKVPAIHYNPASPADVSFKLTSSVLGFPLILVIFGSFFAVPAVFLKPVPSTAAWAMAASEKGQI